MIIEFSVENYRSIKDRVTLSLEAEGSKSKADNVLSAEVKLRNGTGQLRLLKSAALYGPNASGKSTLILAMKALRTLVTNSTEHEIGEPIQAYDPFLLDVDTQEKPVQFELFFILQQVKYRYFLNFNQRQILEETLDYYPSGREAKVYKRLPPCTEGHFTRVELGGTVEDKDIPTKVFHNQLYLSLFGKAIPHLLLNEVYAYFKNLHVASFLNESQIQNLCKTMARNIADGNNESLRQRVNDLIRAADTRIEEIKTKKLDKNAFQFPEDVPEDFVDYILDRESTRTVAVHKVYENGKERKRVEFDLLRQESQGTRVLFALGGIILKTLDEGGVLFFDELDNSLHPDLCQFVVRLFREPQTNPKGAQLVFTTHDVTLLDQTAFRKDQIWFTQKDQYGATELFCTADFDGVREDTNYEHWYRTGKFGAKPKLQQTSFIYR